METLRIDTPEFRWTAYAAGEGDDVWVGFHGFGQGGQHLLRFMRILRPGARCIAFDLPHHGTTEAMNSGTPRLTSAELTDCFEKLLRQCGAKRCSVIGFSLGGKCALTLLESAPVRLRSVVLIAPDGLYINPIYWLATHTAIGRWAMQRMVRDPSGLYRICNGLERIGLLPKAVNQFFRSQLGTAEQRMRVYAVWQTFGHMQPDLNAVRSHVVRYAVDLHLVFGKDDKVIRPKWAKKLHDPRWRHSKLLLLGRAHNLTKREVAEELKDLLIISSAPI